MILKPLECGFFIKKEGLRTKALLYEKALYAFSRKEVLLMAASITVSGLKLGNLTPVIKGVSYVRSYIANWS